MFACADFCLVPNHIFYCSHHLIHLVLGTWIGQQLRKYLRYLFSFVGFEKFYFSKKLVTRSYFCGHKLFVHFKHILWIFHRPRLSLSKAHIFYAYFFCAPKWRKNIKKLKRKSQRIPKNNDSQKQRKKRGKSETISRGAHRERHLGCVCVCWFSPYS